MRRIALGYRLPLLLAGVSIVPSVAAQSLRPMTVCVVESGKLQEVTASYDPSSGDTTVAGKAFSAAHPSSAVQYAASKDWFIENDLVWSRSSVYEKYGLPRILRVSEVAPYGTFRNVPTFVETGTTGKAEVLYAPVRPGCEFQPYRIVPGFSTQIKVNELGTGSLRTGGPKDEENRHFTKWILRGRAGDVLDFTLESRGFDAFLEVQPLGDPRVVSDDDGGGGTNAKIEYAIPADGLYSVLVTTAGRDQTGDYDLRVTRPSWAEPPRSRRVLVGGDDVQDRLSASDPQQSGAHYHEYLYNAAENEGTVFTLESADFDAYLAVGRMEGTNFVRLAHDDDGGGNRNARLDFTFPADGVYVLRAYGLVPRTGAYTLSAEPKARAR